MKKLTRKRAVALSLQAHAELLASAARRLADAAGVAAGLIEGEALASPRERRDQLLREISTLEFAWTMVQADWRRYEAMGKRVDPETVRHLLTEPAAALPLGEPHVVGTEPPTAENDPAGRFREPVCAYPPRDPLNPPDDAPVQYRSLIEFVARGQAAQRAVNTILAEGLTGDDAAKALDAAIGESDDYGELTPQPPAPCDHDWQEQPGEPPIDTCSKCGARRA
jgi:hypothetical protein